MRNESSGIVADTQAKAEAGRSDQLQWSVISRCGQNTISNQSTIYDH